MPEKKILFVSNQEVSGAVYGSYIYINSFVYSQILLLSICRKKRQ